MLKKAQRLIKEEPSADIVWVRGRAEKGPARPSKAGERRIVSNILATVTANRYCVSCFSDSPPSPIPSRSGGRYPFSCLPLSPSSPSDYVPSNFLV